MPEATEADHKIVINVGCGPPGASPLPAYFNGWRHVRIDVDETAQPDILAEATDLSRIGHGTVDAVWSAHCIEHMYVHEVTKALWEFHRVLRKTGFVCVVVPDLQAIAKYIASDRMHEAVYQSNSGPVTAHDMIFGFGPAIEQGRTAMAHRCGFTPSAILECFRQVPFGEVVLRRRPNLELVAVARKLPSHSASERSSLLDELQL